MFQLSTFLHLVAAVVWVGGMLFLGLVVVPALTRLPASQRGTLVGALGRRFRPIAWGCILVLVATGVANLAFRGVTWEGVASGQALESTFGRLLAAKLGLVALLVALSAAHDLVIGPAAARAAERGLPEAERWRHLASWVGRASTVLAVLAIALGVALARGLPL